MDKWKFPYSSQRYPVCAANMVATSQPLAAQAGLRMLLDGGNAVDAALAAAITLTVVEPTSNGIGSDAFALIWDGHQLHGINGSGCSPKGWSPERFAGRDSMPPLGWDTVTVPGAVSVWWALSERFGSLTFEKLFGPAIGYARDGFCVSPVTAKRWRDAADIYRDYPDFCRTFLPNGVAPLPGDSFICREMADTLQEIAASGGESFYRGALARKMVHCSEQQGGALSLADLASHEPLWVKPIAQHYRGYDVHEIPPNGQGIAALAALGILAHFDLAKFPVDSADSIHLQVEAMKLAFADVFRHVGDEKAMRLNCMELLEPGYLKERSLLIDMENAGFPETGIIEEKGTVYLTSGDADGMMVSYIQSNFNGFGSGVVVPGTGISLHNRGCGFSLEAGHPNQVGGGKRPFHTIIPAFVTENGKPVLSFGVMGAHMQAQGHVQMITRIFDYGQNPQAASDAPRWHVMPDMKLALERGFAGSVVEELIRRGHTIVRDEPEKLFGGAQLIRKSGDFYVAGSDHRKDGQAVGF